MKIEVTVKTRICYWQGTALHEIYFDSFDGIIRCQEGTTPPEIHFIKGIVSPERFYISIIFMEPVIIDKNPNEDTSVPVMYIYPTPKD